MGVNICWWLKGGEFRVLACADTGARTPLGVRQYCYYLLQFQDSIRVSRNMEYNYEDTSEVPDVQQFKEELIEELLKSAFFQHKSEKKYNMLKLPILAAPTMIRKQVNNDFQKQTIMEKEFEYSENSLSVEVKIIFRSPPSSLSNNIWSLSILSLI